MAQPTNNQNAFWEAMKEKYERRNDSLRRQETCLRKRLEQLKDLMEKQQIDGDCDCVPEKLEKTSLVQCLVEKGKNLILGSCKCGDPKLGEEYLCACGVDSDAPLNIDNNLCPIPSPPPEIEGCYNPECDFYNPEMVALAKNPSTFSLKTTDIYYMDKLAELVKTEKSMQEKIEDLEKREHSYLSAIKELREAMQKKPKDDPLRNEFAKMAEGLEEENKRLKNELQDMRLELKHCFERVEGPLRRSLDDQKEKCARLERELVTLQEKMTNKEDNYLKEINEIKAKLCKACCTMVDLNSVNSKLKEDLSLLQTKCTNLEDELLKQQLKEAENILKFKDALAKRSPRPESRDDTEDLGRIARKLSETLKEACPCITDIPSGVTETIENIKQLTEFVGKKGTRKTQKNATCSCTCCLDEETIPTPIPMPETQSVTCSCSTSSLRLRPIMTARSAACETSRIDCSCSVSLASMTPRPPIIPTNVSAGCSCRPDQGAQAVQTKPPPKNEIKSTETICSCTKVKEKQIGPSEEVLAVKNLGSLSAAAKKKLAVDTTWDILDVPPTDIHVTTKIAKSGSLEITTEGPPGVIETKVNYLPDGKIEIVTKLVDKDKMAAALDGTLLGIPDQVQPGVDCDNSRTCGGECDENTTRAIGDDDVVDVPNPDDCKCVDEAAPYSQSVVTNFMQMKENPPFLTTEWKNMDFGDDNNEESLLNIIPKRRNAYKNQENIIDADPDEILPKSLGISSRPSLIDVSKCPLENTNFIQPDQLETIIEGDEDEDVSVDDSESSLEEVFGSDDMKEFKHENVVEIVTIAPELLKNEDDEEIVSPLIEETREDFSREIADMQAFGDGVITNVYSEETVINLTLQNSSSHLEIELKSLFQQAKNLQCDINNSKKYLDTEIPQRNTNILRNNLQLKQSKSMYEKTESRVERLRVCKSATLSFGLKVDLDTLKLWSESSGGSFVGDFDQKKMEAKVSDVLVDILCPMIPLETGGSILEPAREVPELTYQCFMCKCSENKDSKAPGQGANRTNDNNLEARIDRLLEVNPLQAAHGPNCQCVDCLTNAAENSTSKMKKSSKCGCSKTLKPPFSANINAAAHGCTCAGKNRNNKQEHGKDCTCVDCLCNPCNFKKKSGIPCDCQQCDCSECTDPVKSTFEPFEFPKPPDIFVMNVTIPCDCPGKCECDPCMDEAKNAPAPPPAADKPQGKLPPCKKCQNRVAAQAAQRPSILKKTVACGSSPIKPTEQQKCEGPSKIPTGNGPDTWKHVVASCGPQTEKKEVCECKPCECKPCGYPDKPRKPCDCKPPKKEPKEPPKKGNDEVKIEVKEEIIPEVKKVIPIESSNLGKTGNDVIAKIPLITPKIEPSSPGKDVQVSGKTCNCVTCDCEFCLDSKVQSNKTKVNETIGDVEFESPNVACDCKTCECVSCLGTKGETTDLVQKELKERLEIFDAEVYTFDKPIPCDCSPCECQECKGVKPPESPAGGEFESEGAQGDQSCPCSQERGFHELPMGECHDCLICDKKSKSVEIELDQPKEKEPIPCDCAPCVCEPCPDPLIIGDFDPTKRELEDVLNKIGCTCDLAEDKLKPLVKQASNFETTISKMKFKLNNLEEKCRDKDQIIKAMTNELRLRSKSGVFANLLNELAHSHEENVPDFNRTYVCDYLPRPKHTTSTSRIRKQNVRFDNSLEPILELDRYLPGEEVYYNNNTNVSDMEILDIRRITIDSILIKWRKPSNICGIIGYQIFVNEHLKYRVLSPNRTNAVLDSLSLDNSLEIMLFAMTMSGRCEPPALATYKI